MQTPDPPPSSTKDFRTGGLPTPDRPDPVRFAPEAGRLAAAGRGIESLLRKRLRYVGLAVVVVYAFFSVDAVRITARAPGLFASYGFVIAFNWLVFAAAGAITAWLWSKRLMSVGSLRTAEAVLFGAVLADISLSLFAQLFVQHDLLLLPALAEGGNRCFIYANHCSMLYFALIVGYGVLIPSTWRHCVLVVGVMALTLLTMTTTAAIADGLASGDLTDFLVPIYLYMAIAAGIAVYGAHRIEALRQEAAEARALGQYILGRSLGAGGMGEVYLAEHALLRRPCAVKLIRPERAGDSRSLQRFEREAQATATLTHPNAVQVFDYGRAEDGTFYYVMEYLPGLTLDELVGRHGPLPPGRAVHFLRQICGPLREAHAVGLIHRDIKPGNVMVCERGGRHDVAKLLDFGLVLSQAPATEGEKLTREGALAGTPAYMSPEQAAGSEGLDGRSDIYSVGAVGYFLLTGRPPFAGRSGVQALAAHLYEQPQPVSGHRPDVPAELEAVVLRCLAKDPAERFGDAGGLEAALAACHTDPWTDEDANRWWHAHAGAADEGTLR
jgi:eukaryotic-like serine/threonine-protein kinase